MESTSIRHRIDVNLTSNQCRFDNKSMLNRRRFNVESTSIRCRLDIVSTLNRCSSLQSFKHSNVSILRNCNARADAWPAACPLKIALKGPLKGPLKGVIRPPGSQVVVMRSYKTKLRNAGARRRRWPGVDPNISIRSP